MFPTQSPPRPPPTFFLFLEVKKVNFYSLPGIFYAYMVQAKDTHNLVPFYTNIFYQCQYSAFMESLISFPLL